jgi:Leucine-rich repeat (LRR) protein
LIYIDLKENIIQEISVGAFKDQGKLGGLYLKQNKLTRIQVGTFDSLTELTDLWLQNNQLSLIDKGLFDKNLKLEYLFLSENQIVAIGSTVFQNLNQQVNISCWETCAQMKVSKITILTEILLVLKITKP